MAITVKWSQKRLRIQSNRDGTPNWGASITWEVDGVTNEREAIEAVPEAQEGMPHPLNNDLIVTAVNGAEPRKGLWEVTADYSTSPTATSPTGSAVVRVWFSFTEGTEMVPFDLDASEEPNPITNSADDAFENPDQRELVRWFYTITMYQPFYDAEMARPFFNTVSSDVLVTPFGTFGPLDVKCLSIMPVEDFIVGMKWIKVAYRFEMRDRSAYPGLPEDMSPFDLRALDQGLNAYYLSGSGQNQQREKGKIVHKADGPVTAPVRLNGDGAPYLSDTYKVTRGLKNSAPGKAPTGATAVPVGDAVYLYWKKYPRKSFAPLDLPTGLS